MSKYIYPVAIAVVLSLAFGIIIGNKMANKEETTTSTNEEETNGASKELNDSVYAKDWDKYLDLAEYKGLSGKKEIMEVTDVDVEDQIQYDLTTSKQITDKKVKDEDTVSIDFVGTIDGEEFDGGRAEDYFLTIGDEELLFEESLIGTTPGDKLTVPVTFPENYEVDATLSGKTAEFDITVNHIDVETTAKLTEEYAKDTLGYESIAEYKSAVKELLETESKEAAEEEAKGALFEIVLENSQLKEYSDEMFEYYEDIATKGLETDAEQWQMDLETYKEFVGLGDDVWEEYVESVIKQELIITAIAKKEDISVSEEEYEEEGLNIAYEQGFETLKDLEEALQGDTSQITELILSSKVSNYIYDNASEIKEIQVSAEDE